MEMALNEGFQKKPRKLQSFDAQRESILIRRENDWYYRHSLTCHIIAVMDDINACQLSTSAVKRSGPDKIQLGIRVANTQSMGQLRQL